MPYSRQFGRHRHTIRGRLEPDVKRDDRLTTSQRWQLYQRFLRTLMTEAEALALERSVRPGFDRMEACRERLLRCYPLMRDAQIDRLLYATDTHRRA